MRKILIISYFFPPCILTASNRVNGWAKHLSQFGYYPIVVTRNWDVQGSQEKQRLQQSGNSLEIKYFDGYEVHYLPYRPSLRDFCLNKNWKLFSRVLTLVELIFRNFSVQVIPYKNLYFYAKKILKKDNNIRYILISGNPFEQFFFGYKLKKIFPKLSWIAEYRDEWTTRNEYANSRGKNVLIKLLESKSELRWLQKADLLFTTCSYFAKRISDKLNKTVEVIGHGMTEELTPSRNAHQSSRIFKIVYGGTLYSNQPIEAFLQCWESFAQNKNDVELLLLGSNADKDAKKRLEPYISDNISATERVAKIESDRIHSEASLLLLLPYNGMQGWPSSKLYHYMVYKKPIVLFPSDNDIMEKTLIETGLGILPTNDTEMLYTLEEYYKKWKNKQLEPVEGKNLNKFTQVYKTQILSEHLYKLEFNKKEKDRLTLQYDKF